MYYKKEKKIYGITGKKGHGKDTLAKFICEKNKTFVVLHFADSLKKMCCDIFGLSHEQLNDSVLKEQLLEKHIDMDLFLPLMKSYTGLEIIARSLTAKTPREVLQFFGTEYVRKIQDDYWIQKTISQINRHQNCLIADLRFLNEFSALKNINATIIKVLRIDAPHQPDSHVSELEIDKIDPDLLLGVITGDLTIHHKIANLISMGKKNAILKYDYRLAKKAIESYTGGASLEKASNFLGLNYKHPSVLKNILKYYGVPVKKQAANKINHQKQ